MLGENIKALRKSKGLTQEELAIRINVVRQTVSKWEKGFSVPDAEALQKIADVLEVDVKQLLGTGVEMEKSNNNELVEQLARINEQLIIKNKRASRIWKIVGIVLLSIMAINIILAVLAYVLFGVNTSSSNGSLEVKVIEEDMVIEP
ncbi:MAG: helix-turn-helix transcriptional regulator [Lachnospiraceae bacterium]|nr:helix-turn-helix transcriptional regulator [Lachnospiraceae bacterium]